MTEASDRQALSTLVRKHRNVSGKLKKLEGLKKRITDACKEIMERLGAREVLVDDLKAHRYPITKVEWDIPALMSLGMIRGVVLTKIVADEDMIESAVAAGRVDMEEVHSCGNVRSTWGFRVDEVKDE